MNHPAVPGSHNPPAAADARNLPATANAGGMMMSTTDVVPGWTVTKVYGLVRGNTVRVRNIGVDILAAFKNLVGGEIGEYTKMLAQSREQSLDRMRYQALQFGANGVVGVRFTTSTVMQGAAEILVYGTAVTLVAQ